ncbi:Hypp804 [Branchiostoma lanceolatum]|uniref:Hypp804 protein n=1 Tax=Branchiostoma lanceolatum TaxID=7740 RepID=A0A8J9W5E8_BRALA|nr:Hypp804 [Branchiostoma lanceolatum]
MADHKGTQESASEDETWRLGEGVFEDVVRKETSSTESVEKGDPDKDGMTLKKVEENFQQLPKLVHDLSLVTLICTRLENLLTSLTGEGKEVTEARAHVQLLVDQYRKLEGIVKDFLKRISAFARHSIDEIKQTPVEDEPDKECVAAIVNRSKDLLYKMNELEQRRSCIASTSGFAMEGSRKVAEKSQATAEMSRTLAWGAIPGFGTLAWGAAGAMAGADGYESSVGKLVGGIKGLGFGLTGGLVTGVLSPVLIPAGLSVARENEALKEKSEHIVNELTLATVVLDSAIKKMNQCLHVVVSGMSKLYEKIEEIENLSDPDSEDGKKTKLRGIGDGLRKLCEDGFEPLCQACDEARMRVLGYLGPALQEHATGRKEAPKESEEGDFDIIDPIELLDTTN